MALRYPQSTLTDMLFDALSQQTDDLDPTLKQNVKLYPKEVRRRIVSQYKDDMTPLFMAISNCKSKDLIKFLIKDCKADV
ncbi:unnamed protein product [Gordionus sp. m RMFG-2023]